MSQPTVEELDQFRAEYSIPSAPDRTFTTWYDSENDWVSVEIRELDGSLAGSSGFRLAPSRPPEPGPSPEVIEPAPEEVPNA